MRQRCASPQINRALGHSAQINAAARRNAVGVWSRPRGELKEATVRKRLGIR